MKSHELLTANKTLLQNGGILKIGNTEYNAEYYMTLFSTFILTKKDSAQKWGYEDFYIEFIKLDEKEIKKLLAELSDMMVE